MNTVKKWRFLSVIGLCLLSLNPVGAAERPKIGLVLSGGGALGFAHIGTLKLIDSLQIPIDYIAGTSMGGIVGALYAVGYTGKEIEQIARSVDWQKVFTDRPPRSMLPYFRKEDAEKYQFELGIKDFLPLGPGGAIVGQNITLLLSRLVFDYADVSDFDSLPTPFRCVAVDLITGNEVVLKSGSLAKAMRSTMAVPSIFSPVEWGDSLLVDGGLLNNLPVDVARDMGADIVIASTVGTTSKKRTEIRNTLDVISQSFNILREKALNDNAEFADILIDTRLYKRTAADFENRKVLEIIAEGEKAAEASKQQLIDLKVKYHLHSNRFYRESLSSDSSYKIVAIKVQGNLVIPESAIRDIVKIHEGDCFCRDTIDTYMEKLKETGDFAWVRYSTKEVGDKALQLTISLEEKKRPIIYGINIYGNKTLPFDFIYRILGIKPGEIFIHSKIEDRITYLYSLGYFEKIYYDVDPAGENSVRFKLYVKESPKLKVRFGLRYDNYYQLIAALNFQIVNKPIPGLQIENEFQFIGRGKISSRAYYPSRTLSFPLYPFIDMYYDDMDYFIYDENGNKAATYKNRNTQLGGGFGMLYKNYWNLEASWSYEWANVYPIVALNDPQTFPRWKDEFWEQKLTSNIDRLDDTFIPREGILVHANYEKILKGINRLPDFTRMDVSVDVYRTMARKHTLHVYGFYGFADMDSITNKFIMQGGPRSFVGVDYHQLLATRLSMLRMDYRYQLHRNLYVSVIGNMVLDYENNILGPKLTVNNLKGYGLGLKYVTPLGPFELIIGRGEKSVYQPGAKQTVLYFNAGYKF